MVLSSAGMCIRSDMKAYVRFAANGPRSVGARTRILLWKFWVLYFIRSPLFSLACPARPLGHRGQHPRQNLSTNPDPEAIPTLSPPLAKSLSPYSKRVTHICYFERAHAETSAEALAKQQMRPFRQSQKTDAY